MGNDHSHSGPQFEQTRNTLLNAYPTARDLHEMGLIQLGERLEAIADCGYCSEIQHTALFFVEQFT